MKKMAKGMGLPVAGTALTVAVCAALGALPAEANVVIIPVNTLLGTADIDFNSDGTNEYTFSFDSSPVGFENVLNTYTNQVVGYTILPPDPKAGTYASLLHAGELIDGSDSYVNGSSVFLSGAFFIFPFGDFYGNSGFAGLSFGLPGESGVHYGWAELQNSSAGLTVVEVGYETQQDTGIVTPGLVPEPGTLALLAAGAVGVLALRRRRQAVA
jgi:hypothetical protein